MTTNKQTLESIEGLLRAIAAHTLRLQAPSRGTRT